MQVEKVKVLKCSNTILWYSKYINEEFNVLWSEDRAFWVREPSPPYNPTNWILKEDCEVIIGTN